ncbi:MAG: folate family ECF transporter S component [Ruminococcus sp.]|nr:folate family ECF transporter S component [Ruminococcus sp.]MEE0674957.1 folate family ECF transporter S component [Ruminococcus sp.]MEE0857661.1 folate family ECF transporter S component [Ruminococcus sp.]
MSQIKRLSNSALELKSVYGLAVAAMLLAIRVVLGLFANATLPMFGNTVKISAAFLPIAAAGALLGPVPAMLVGALGDVLSYIISPSGAYIPGFTISGALTGLIYGFAFYKNKITIPRVVGGWFANMLLVETFLAAFWFYEFFNPGFQTPYTTFLVTRFISVAIKCIPEILLIFVTGKLLGNVSKLDKQHKAAPDPHA